MSASLRSRLDLAELSEQLSSLNRTRSRDELAETLLGLLVRTLGQDHILLILLDPDDTTPSVYGGSFEERREVRAGLQGSAFRDGIVDLTSAPGRGMRVIPIRDERTSRGAVLVEADDPTLADEDLEYVQFLADRAAEVIPRHSLHAEALAAARSRGTPPTPAAEPVRTKRAIRTLCIEEDPTSLSLLRAIFEQGGHDVHCDQDPQSAAGTFGSHSERGTGFDLVIAGMTAAGSDVLGAIRNIRAEDASVGILILAPEGIDLPSDLRSERRIRTLTRMVDPVALRFCVQELLAAPRG